MLDAAEESKKTSPIVSYGLLNGWPVATGESRARRTNVFLGTPRADAESDAEQIWPLRAT